MLYSALIAVIFVLIGYIFYLLNNNFKLKATIRSERLILQKQSQMEERFKTISNEVLLQSHKHFVNIAKDTFEKVLSNGKTELDKKENNFLNLIQPIQNTLKNFDEKISRIEKDRVESYADLRRQVQDMIVFQQELQKQTTSLNKALSSPTMTGQWGEMQLRRVVELSGMISHCDFYEQQQNENSGYRPDMIIKLPGNRNIIVDAKTPLFAYMKAINDGDTECLKAHAEAIKKHVKLLSQKSYWAQFAPTPEFVLMFLPGESFFSTAIKVDPNLIEYGIKEKVIITTPITLIALLKTIAFSWHEEAVTQNARKIGEEGRNVYNYLAEFIDKVKDFEKKLQKNTEDFSKLSTFIDKKVAPSALKLKTLGIEVNKENE